MAYFEDKKFNPHEATFTPSVSTTYFQKVSKRRGDFREDIPPRLKSMTQFWWWQHMKGIKPFFYYPYFMYSAGHAELDLEKAQEVEGALFKRDRSQNVVITDSGGFQIGTNPDFFDWNSATKIDEKREKIYRWIDAVADYSITLEAPGWGASPEHKRLKTFDDCLAFTLENLEHYESRKNKNENVRFLHALHGSTIEEQTKWFDAVKGFRHYGWALSAASHHAPFRNLKNLLRMLMFLKQEGALEKAPHVHVLGIGASHAAVVYSYIQYLFRKNGLDNFQITYDVSSACSQAGQQGALYTSFEPAILGGRLERVVEQVVPKTGWEAHGVPMGHETLPRTLDFESPVFGYAEDKDRMMPKHLQPWSDGISLSLMMAHNIWLQTEIYKGAHSRFRLARARARVEVAMEKKQLGKLLNQVAKHFNSHGEIESIAEDVNSLFYAIHREGIMPPGWRRGDRGMSLEYFMHLRSVIENVVSSKDPFSTLDKHEDVLSSHLGGRLVGYANKGAVLGVGTSCGSEKIADNAPARKIYGSSRIAFASDEAEEINVPFFILSAGYGLISGDEEIDRYEQIMDAERAKELHWTVVQQLKESGLTHFIFFKAGVNASYASCMRKACATAGIYYEEYGDKTMQGAQDWLSAAKKWKAKLANQ